MIWIKQWLLEAVAAPADISEKGAIERHQAQQMLQDRGLKRMRRDVLAVPGKVRFQGKQVIGIRLNPLYPLIQHVSTACNALFEHYDMQVLLDKT